MDSCCTRLVDNFHTWMVAVTGGSSYTSRGGKSTYKLKEPPPLNELKEQEPKASDWIIIFVVDGAFFLLTWGLA